MGVVEPAPAESVLGVAFLADADTVAGVVREARTELAELDVPADVRPLGVVDHRDDLLVSAMPARTDIPISRSGAVVVPSHLPEIFGVRWPGSTPLT